MAIPKRHGNPPGTYFMTSRTWENRRLFVTSRVCEIFVDTLFRYRTEGAYGLHVFVLMPDHFHVLLTPAMDKSLERVAQYIKGGCSHSMGESVGLRYPVWQRGFSDHRIRDAADYTIHLDYIEQNPVKGHLTTIASDYPWCSACGKFEMDDPPQRLKPLPVAGALRHG